MAAIQKPSIAGSASDLKARQRGEQQQREASPTILSPQDVLGDYDGARLLMTTIGGTPRAITSRDLQAFKQNATIAGKKFKGGITPQGVIDHSRKEDRERSKEQIRYAVPSRSKGAEIQFVTNAGPDSNVARHFVTIELVAFPAGVASPRTPLQAADAVTRAGVKFDCDCGRHTFWYRYISTVGRFNAGRVETGFPKIRNPMLVGVACKHVLRVMVALREGGVRSYVGKMIETARKQIARKTQPAPATAVKEILAQQAAGTAKILTSAQKRAAAPATARLRAKAKRAIEAITARNRTAADKARVNIASLVKLGVISQKQADAMLARLKG